MWLNGKKSIVVTIFLLSIIFSTGCTNWKKKYQLLNVEHQNVLGLFERTKTEKDQLSGQVIAGQQTIEDLKREIEERNVSPAEASGFGEDYDVTFDASAGTITVTVQDSILFSAGKATLKKAISAELSHIQDVLQSKYPGKQIDVIGHTDSDPIKKSKWKDNWELSAQRALTVTRYLIKQGIAEDMIREIGCGAARPIALNTSLSGRARNRRVEIVVHLR